MLVKWLGNASFFLKTSGLRVYIDPYAGDYLEKADLVLITHGHGDHCDLGKLRLIQTPQSLILTSKPVSQALTGRVEAVFPGDTRKIGKLKVTAVESYNMRTLKETGKPCHPRGTQVGFLLCAEGKTVYHLGDTDLLPSMKKLGPVDLALIPIGGGKKSFMDVDEAVEAACCIHPRIVIPMHWGKADPHKFKEKTNRVFPEVKVEVLKPGDTLAL